MEVDLKEKVYFSDYLIARNSRSLLRQRSLVSMVSGAMAGILGLSGINGFILYTLCSLCYSMMLYLFATKCKPHLYFKSPADSLLLHGVFGEFLTYLLFWTLVYGLVHIYD